MQNPLDIPKGGIMIFRTETGVRPSRMRHAMTTARATREPATAVPLGKTISVLQFTNYLAGGTVSHRQLPMHFFNPQVRQVTFFFRGPCLRTL
jgi:hypothetical protein